MTALGITEYAAALPDLPNPPRQSHIGASRLTRNGETVKNRQNRQCLFCGRSCGRYHKLEVDHVRRQRNGGTDAQANLRALCHGCHRFRHNVEREIPAAARLILAIQALSGATDGRAVNWACSFLFRCFLRSEAGAEFYQGAMFFRAVRPTARVLSAASRAVAA